MENTNTPKRVKRQVVDINDVNELRRLIAKAMEQKGVTKYAIYRRLDMLPMTLRGILKESESGFNVISLIRIMKMLDIKFVVETEQENVLDKS
jgi:hypothetical protein